MTRGSNAANPPITEVAPYPGHDPDRKASVLEHWTLLDVDLEVGGNRAQVDKRLAAGKALGIGAGFAHVEHQRIAGVPVREREILVGQLAEQRRRAEIGLAKPRALLAAKRNRAKRPSGCRALATHANCAEEAGNDPREAIVIAALWDRIGVRAGDDAGKGRVAPGHRHPKVAGRVVGRIYPLGRGRPLEKGEYSGLHVAIRRARNTAAITAQGPNMRE